MRNHAVSGGIVFALAVSGCLPDVSFDPIPCDGSACDAGDDLRDVGDVGDDLADTTSADAPTDLPDSPRDADVVDALDATEDAPVDAEADAPVDAFEAGVDVAEAPDAAEVGSCPDGGSRCGAACASLRDDPMNCGACSRVCAIPGASSVCVDGACQMTTCATGLGDCDRDPTNGCETNLGASGAHCGRCGNACASGQVCVGTACLATQRSCPDATELGCGMEAVPGGTFAMGDPMARSAAPLQTMITVSSYLMDRFEVTVARFRRFVDAGMPGIVGDRISYPGGFLAWPTGRALFPPALPVTGTITEFCNWSTTPGAKEDHPINCVDWYSAVAFCVWDGSRLPTEAEWEFVARGSEGRIYPWGASVPDGRICTARDYPWGTCPVSGAAFAAGRSPSGLWHLSGNVDEWVADRAGDYASPLCWGNVHRTNPLCTVRPMGETEDTRAIRGNSYSYFSGIDRPDLAARAAGRSSNAVLPGSALTGFRCSR